MTYLEMHEAIRRVKCRDTLIKMAVDMALSLYVVARPEPLDPAHPSVMAASAERALVRAENTLNKRA